MQANAIEHRTRRRVEFFRVPAQGGQVPVWVFKPDDAIDASAGLVVDMGEGGLQVLTASDDPLDGARYEIQLLLGEGDAVPRFRGRVARVWAREAGLAGRLTGLRFEQARSDAEAFIRAWQASAAQPSWVRCVLLPAR